MPVDKLIPHKPRVIAQGLTGKEGTRALPGMLGYGTTVTAGVTPGKGGTSVGGVPIFNTVDEAIAAVGLPDMAVQFVPPLHALRAAKEVFAANIPLLLVGAEKVPVHDALLMHALAKRSGSILVGPGSVGLIVPRQKLKLGMIGGDDPKRAFAPGAVAVISKSGGMTSEIAIHLKHHGLGVSFAAGIGGERIAGSDFADLLSILEEDGATKASVIFGEIGGGYEERVADFVKEGKIRKPVIAFIAGDFVERFGLHETPFGHAGAILEKNRGGAEAKRTTLRSAGVHVVSRIDDIAAALAPFVR